MKYTILIMLFAVLTACEPFPAPLPLDWPFPHQDTIVQDTIVQDTLPQDTIPLPIPCETYTPVDTPYFVCAYMIFDSPQNIDSILWQGGGISSHDLGDVIEAVFPGHSYSIWPTPLTWGVIIDGVPYNSSILLKIFCRVDGAKRYLGWIDRGFMFYGALTQQEFSDVVDKYHSVKYFNFKDTHYDSLFYEDAAYRILGHCKKGGKWADFRFNPYTIPDTIITQYQDAKWEKVLH